MGVEEGVLVRAYAAAIVGTGMLVIVRNMNRRNQNPFLVLILRI